MGADAPASGGATKGGETKPPAGKPGETAGGEKVQWLSFDAAVVKAQKENKHLLVDVYTNWCGWCKVMDRQTYGNAEVAAYLAENFALAKVNGESAAKLTWNGKTLTEREFAKAVGVNGYPSTFSQSGIGDSECLWWPGGHGFYWGDLWPCDYDSVDHEH